MNMHRIPRLYAACAPAAQRHHPNAQNAAHVKGTRKKGIPHTLVPSPVRPKFGIFFLCSHFAPYCFSLFEFVRSLHIVIPQACVTYLSFAMTYGLLLARLALFNARGWK